MKGRRQRYFSGPVSKPPPLFCGIRPKVMPVRSTGPAVRDELEHQCGLSTQRFVERIKVGCPNQNRKVR